MARPVYIDRKVSLAFAAVVICGAAFIATNFDGVKDIKEPEGDYAEMRAEPAPDAGTSDYVEPADGWYDDAAVDEAGIDGPIDDAQGFDPSPALSTDPGAEEYVILEGEALPTRNDGGEVLDPE